MRKGQKKCIHRYKGIYGLYQPVFRNTRDGYWITEYVCQIKGCHHKKLAFKNKMPKKQKELSK